MNLRERWAAIQRWYAAHSTRDRRILASVAGAIGLSLVYVIVVEPIVQYRRRVAAEIAEGQEQLERAARFVAAADTVQAERDQLKGRLEQAKQRLLPAGSGTLGAAALQERANAVAAEKGITVQSTQVMKEEPADPFRKVSIRLVLSGELKPFSEMLAALEYGPQQLAIPFLEVSRRGAVAGAKGPRTLSATVEVGGYLLSEVAAKAEAAEGEAEAAVPPAEGEAPAEGQPPVPPAADAPPPAGPDAAGQPPAPEVVPPPAEAAPLVGPELPRAAAPAPEPAPVAPVTPPGPPAPPAASPAPAPAGPASAGPAPSAPPPSGKPTPPLPPAAAPPPPSQPPAAVAPKPGPRPGAPGAL